MRVFADRMSVVWAPNFQGANKTLKGLGLVGGFHFKLVVVAILFRVVSRNRCLSGSVDVLEKRIPRPDASYLL